MKTNKLIKWIIGIITLMPLIIIGVGLLTTLFTYRINTGSFAGFPLSVTLTNTFDSLNFIGLMSFDISGDAPMVYLGTGAISTDIDYGVFNFVGLFNNVFINLDAATDYGSFYLFINWYLNYILFIQVICFAPRVLMWFINFCFSLFDSFTEKSKGW